MTFLQRIDAPELQTLFITGLEIKKSQQKRFVKFLSQFPKLENLHLVDIGCNLIQEVSVALGNQLKFLAFGISEKYGTLFTDEDV
jgi:hypothetical protein